jgi:hypothetical protein
MQGMITRNHLTRIEHALDNQAGVVLLGPRQVGKTTLAQDIAETRDAVYLDMERLADRQILEEPDLYLDEQAGKLVVIDEVQLMPGLFGALRGQIDRRRRAGHRTGQFLLLGSASNTLLQQSAESLAGRVSYHELTPLTLDEVGQGLCRSFGCEAGFRIVSLRDRIAKASPGGKISFAPALLHGSLTSRNAPYPRRISCGTREAGAAKFGHPVEHADANIGFCFLACEVARL